MFVLALISQMVSTVLQYGPLEFQLYNRSLSITQFKAIFADAQCFTWEGCSGCLQWKNLTVNEQILSGCGVFSAGCGVAKLFNYNLGCFRDTQVGPQCFGSFRCYSVLINIIRQMSKRLQWSWSL